VTRCAGAVNTGARHRRSTDPRRRTAGRCHRRLADRLRCHLLPTGFLFPSGCSPVRGRYSAPTGACPGPVRRDRGLRGFDAPETLRLRSVCGGGHGLGPPRGPAM